MRATATTPLALTRCRWPLLLIALLLGARLGAQTLEVSSPQASRWIERDGDLVLELSREPTADEGRLAVVLDRTDITDLFASRDRVLLYRAQLLLLPAGEHDLVVYLVSPENAWTEIARVQLKVRRAAGIEEVESSFQAEIQSSAQFETGGSPEENVPQEVESATSQLGWSGSLQRRGWRYGARVDTLGVSEIENALRFAELGADAERFDLSSYLLRIEKNRTFFELGHLSYGSHQHLVGGMSGRGLGLGFAPSERMELSAAAISATALVGWDDLLGSNRSEHRALTASLGLELLAKRPGGLRLDLDYLDASRLPLADFNQGSVNDAEENDGWGLRLAGSTRGQRLSFRGGYARSEFRNPADPLLAQGFDLVPVASEEREARYLDVDVALVPHRQIGGSWSFGLELGLRHLRVEPQYRSVAAYAQADIDQNGADLSATIGAINAQVSHSRSEDNLDDIPSILKTETRQSAFSLGVPLPMVFSSKPRPWLPTISYSLGRTEQFGANQPIGGDFNATSHIPDQLSTNHNFTLDWRGNRWQFGYSFNDSQQDNRQPGRELDDFTNTSHGLRLSLAPVQKLDLGLEYSRDRAFSFNDRRIDRNERYGFNLTLRPTTKLSFNGSYSLTETADEPLTGESESTLVNLEAAYRFAWREQRKHGGSAQLFLRYADQDLESRDRVFGFDFLRDDWRLTAGLNLSLR